MIRVNEMTDYKTGYDLSQIIGQICSIKTSIDDGKEVGLQELSVELDDIIGKLLYIHEGMVTDIHSMT